MGRLDVNAITKTRRTSAKVLHTITAIRQRAQRKGKEWDSVKILRAIRHGR